MIALQFLKNLGTALPLSDVKNQDGSHKPMSNSEIGRLCEQRAVLFNGETVKFDGEIDFPVFSLVVWPKSDKRRVTVV